VSEDWKQIGDAHYHSDGYAIRQERDCWTLFRGRFGSHAGAIRDFESVEAAKEYVEKQESAK
jgi:hypothetical protein